MARSPSRSSDGGSEHRERAEPRLLKAIDECKDDEAIAIIEHAKSRIQPTQPLLRIGLMRAAERGNANIAEYLLKNGAKPDGAAGGRVSPLLKAVEKNHVGVVQLLLKYGGNVDVADKQGRTALMSAAWRNHFHILDTLLKGGADINKKDNKGRNVLHNLAADKHCNWGRDVIDVLLRTNIAIDGVEGQDELKRSPLHWAAVTGKKELCEMLLMRPRTPRANINAVEVREKTSLHLAVAHEKDPVVELLLKFGADVNARSDGSWTPLHNACEKDNAKNVRVLLEYGAELNAKLLNGMTPLHVAAQAGHLDVVKCLLDRKDLKRAARDTFGITPFLRAAQNKRKDIVALLAPFNNVEGLNEDALGACNGFNATIVDFGNFHNENKVRKRTVYELLYGRDAVNPRKPAVSILPTDSKATSFRWIHLPANNMAWVEALLTKAFIEEGANDFEGYKALERSFNHQHRGQQVHSHFMRPLCQSTPRAPKHAEESEFSDSAEHGPPQIIISGSPGLGISITRNATPGAQENTTPKTPVRTDTISTDATDFTRTSATSVVSASASGKDQKGHGKNKDKSKKSAKWSNSRQAKPSGGTDTPTKSDHHARRKISTPLTSSGHLRSPGSPGRKDPTAAVKGNIFTFMPYLHFETNKRRQEMQAAIARAELIKRKREKSDGQIRKPVLHRASTYDEMLLRAHLSSSTVSLHVRRTLDQFFYHNIDTQSRDEDQVVYRYQMRDRGKSQFPNDNEVDPKIFMVDQLWMWILGKDLIVTAFPQRWQQPKNDPLNVLDGIIEDINSKTREPVRSVYDLALIITGRCSGVFDRNRMDEDYQFLDMFEASIGDATEEETKLFRDFNVASAQASQWLQHHRRPNRFSRHLEAEGRVIEHQNKHAIAPHSHSHTLADHPIHEEKFKYDGSVHAPLFVDKLLDIGAETDLLAETKDIRDELNMIAKVLEDQYAVLPDLELSIIDIYREEHKSQIELKRRFRDQRKTIEVHLKDIDRMDKQAERIYKSITDLLDLKQKHANAFEARFARDQAAGTARQSQTVMVFTIVTIVFLPLSFIAAFFTINIREFPRLQGGSEPSLPLSYVSKYMFGIGFLISIPLVVIALSLDAIGDSFREVKRRWRERGSKRRDQATVAGAMSSEKVDITYTVDTLALQEVLSAGRSTRGRRSYDSNAFGGSLLPVTSRGTVRTVNANGHVNSTGLGKVDVEVVRPIPVGRQSTGFRMRGSHDAERGR
jgi:ankyrin repeat protein/Mg2+ and Co2+ transporter CorA